MNRCMICDGEGFTGSDAERAPWSFWASLPPGSDIAVRLGFVVKITCESCSGSGLHTFTAEIVDPEPEDSGVTS